MCAPKVALSVTLEEADHLNGCEREGTCGVAAANTPGLLMLNAVTRSSGDTQISIRSNRVITQEDKNISQLSVDLNNTTADDTIYNNTSNESHSIFHNIPQDYQDCWDREEVHHT